MRILHVNDVASVASLLVEASAGRDALFQPALRRSGGRAARGMIGLARSRLADWRRVGQTIRAGNFSHLHVHYGTFALLGAGRPYSLHLHGGDLLHDLGSGLKGVITRAALRRAVHVVVSTPDLLPLARSWRPDARYIPNPMPLPAESARRSRAAASELMLVSKMDPRKGWERQLQLVHALVEVVPDLRVVFLDHGRLSLAAREPMRRSLTALGATPLPPMPRPAFLKRMAQADLILGQLEVGALGMSELEAMARGIPTIADARAHGAAETTPPVIDPEDAVALVPRLLQSDDQWSQLSWHSRAYVKQVHDPQTVLHLLEMVLASR